MEEFDNNLQLQVIFVRRGKDLLSGQSFKMAMSLGITGFGGGMVQFNTNVFKFNRFSIFISWLPLYLLYSGLYGIFRGKTHTGMVDSWSGPVPAGKLF